MGVTIDQIQIEIQSNSMGAAQGIMDFARALGELKKNGSLGVATKNLQALSTSLQTLSSAYQASNALRNLANAMERLKGVGSVASIANSLSKLPVALRSLETIQIDSVEPKVRSLVTALAPLSSMKAGGLSSMVNAMSRLGKVTESLDDATIAAFAQKVELLNTKLGPLSAKMATIKDGFSAVNVNARQATTSVQQFDTGINTSTLNMASFITVMQSAFFVIQRVAQGLSYVISMAIEWDGIAARFGRGFGSEAAETYAWIQRLNEEMGINVQEFMQYSSVYATMLNGFGVAAEDAGKMALGYMELTYDIWAGYNDIYGSLGEAADAVRSAIAGEVEPIRRAGFTIIESTLEQTAKNHGLAISLETATEAQKSYLRYLTLVDQAHAQSLVGTYAKELDTAEGLMRTFSQQLKSLAQVFGSLFLPILVKVMPYLQAFVDLLTDGIRALAAMFGIKLQEVDWSGYNSGAVDATENIEGVTGALDDATAAAKELKNAAIGIDELNVISPNAGSSGSGGSGGSGGGAGGGFTDLDVDSLWDESIFDTIQSQVDEIKGKMKQIADEWMPYIKTIGGALAAWGIAKLLENFGTALKLSDDFLGVVNTIKKLAATAVIITLQFKLMKDAFGDFLGEDGTILDYIEAILIGGVSSYLLYSMWGVGGLSIGLGVTAVAALSAVIEDGSIDSFNDVVVLLTGLASAIGAVALAVKALKASGFIAWITEFIAAAKLAAPEVGIFAALFPKLSTALSGFGGTIAGLASKIPGALSAVASALSAAAPYIAIAVAVVGGLVLAFVDYDFSEIGHTIGKKIGEAISGAGKWIWDALKTAFNWVKDNLDIEDFWDVLKILFVPGELFRRVAPLVTELFKTVGDFINDKIENLKGNINEFFSGFFTGLLEGLGVSDEWIEKITSFFDIDYTSIIEMVVNPRSIGKYILNGIANAILGKEKVEAIKTQLSDMWTNAKTWWDTKKAALASYTPSIGNIATKLSTAWTSAKDWWDKKKAKLASYTPSIGSIYEPLAERWNNAKEWWNKKKTKLNSYTPSIGSIYEPLAERWKNAKEWWNKKKGSLSYTPSIGSITDKIKSAWNSAKSWWNKNVSLSTKLNIQVPTIKVKWETATAFGKSFKYPTGFTLNFAAAGGIFDQGSMIWAGERGPEIVANAAGGKTGVMNVQQMQDAVYEGVYAAVVSAMRGGSGGSQELRVYLDGREIAANVKKHERESGATIMGNEVYA